MDRFTYRPLPMPLYDNIIDRGGQRARDPVRLFFWKDNGSSVTTRLKSFPYLWDVVSFVSQGPHCANVIASPKCKTIG